MRARGAGCEVEMQLKRRAAGFPFSLLPPGGFPFSLENTPFPPTSYPALAGLIGIYIYILFVCLVYMLFTLLFVCLGCWVGVGVSVYCGST